MEKILEVTNLAKKFASKEVLKNVNMTIYEGDILAFIGPNGAGKTTTIKLILGLQSIDKGKVLINGYDINKDFVNALKRVGSIVENPDLYMYLTGYENLKLRANLYPNIKEEKIQEVVKLVGLESRINDKVSKYSLGMRQRLGIAQSLLNEPNLLIFDEPTNGLDPEGIKDLRILLKSLAQKGMGILISSHNLAQLESFCNKVCIIDKGISIDVNSVDKLKHQNISSYIFKVDSTQNINLKNMENVSNDSFTLKIAQSKVPGIINTLVKQNIKIYEVKEEQISLEEVFFEKAGGKKNV